MEMCSTIDQKDKQAYVQLQSTHSQLQKDYDMVKQQHRNELMLKDERISQLEAENQMLKNKLRDKELIVTTTTAKVDKLDESCSSPLVDLSNHSSRRRHQNSEYIVSIIVILIFMVFLCRNHMHQKHM